MRRTKLDYIKRIAEQCRSSKSVTKSTLYFQRITVMDLIAIHKAPSEYKDDIKNQCCEILNDEWPRSETLRLRSLNSSRDDLPLCLALVEWFQNASKGKIIISIAFNKDLRRLSLMSI